MSIGKRLKEARGTLSQKELAARIGIHPVTLGRYENEKRVPDVYFLQVISDNTGYSTNWLLTGEGEKLLPPVSPPTTLSFQECEELNFKQFEKNIEAINKQGALATPPYSWESHLHDKRQREWRSKVLSEIFDNSPLSSEKYATCCSEQSEQPYKHTEKPTENKKDTCDESQFSELKAELLMLYRKNAGLIYENMELQTKCSSILHDNGDLRVEIERQKARIAELERELARILKGEESPPVASAG